MPNPFVENLKADSASALKANRPALYLAIKKLVDYGQSACQIDTFIGEKFNLPEGNATRDLCYYAAMYMSDIAKAPEVTP